MKFDFVELKLKKATRSIWSVVRDVAYFVGLCIFMTVVVYLLFTAFFRTDTERRLIRENRMYEKNYSELLKREELLKDAIASLQYEDADIYDHVFHSDAPNVDPIGKLDILFSSDTIPASGLAGYTWDKARELEGRCASVDSAFFRIFSVLTCTDSITPPMALPLRDITYLQVGASTGRRLSPFYKAYVQHDGLDLIGISGTPVYATADGVVTGGTGSSKSYGKTVEIMHDGGYVTRYSHLENILVGRGQRVTCGQKIGTVGMSGKSYAPHLHYEVLRNGRFLDPMNFIFASVTPGEYANMLYMAVTTNQSID